MLNKSDRETLYFRVMNDGEVIRQQISKDTGRTISDAIYNSIEPSIIPTIETKANAEEISKEISLSVDTVKKSTANLAEIGFIFRKGSKCNGYWFIKKDE